MILYGMVEVRFDPRIYKGEEGVRCVQMSLFLKYGFISVASLVILLSSDNRNIIILLHQDKVI
jgi:hypothetical protein